MGRVNKIINRIFKHTVVDEEEKSILEEINKKRRKNFTMSLNADSTERSRLAYRATTYYNTGRQNKGNYR